METNNTKSTSYNEDDEAWLYGGTNDDGMASIPVGCFGKLKSLKF